MKVKVHYASGKVQDFVVPEGILWADFMKFASIEGDKIKLIEFP